MKLVDKVKLIRSITEGGSGSGNYGHSDRPGEVGGSGGGGFLSGTPDEIESALNKAGWSLETYQKNALNDGGYKIVMIPISKVVQWEYTPPIDVTNATVRDMMTLMKAGYKLPAIEVGSRQKDGSYKVLDGQHRALAWAALGRKTIPGLMKESLEEGGSGSGNYGHAGRPGEVGGSGEGGGEGSGGDGEVVSGLAKKDSIIVAKEKMSVSAALGKDEEKYKTQLALAFSNLPLKDVETIDKVILTAASDENFGKVCLMLDPEGDRDLYAKADGVSFAGMRSIVVRYQDDQMERGAVVIHELGHAVWNKRVSQQDTVFWLKAFAQKSIVFPTIYAGKNHKELFAECYRIYHKKAYWPEFLDKKAIAWFDDFYKKNESIAEGGAGSGNYGHAGRPGEVGGSGEGGGGRKDLITGQGRTGIAFVQRYADKLPKSDLAGIKNIIAADRETFSKSTGLSSIKCAGVAKLDKGEIFINTAAAKEKTIYHEVGHFVLDKLPMKQKNMWVDKFIMGSDLFVTSYAGTSPSELFAENYAYYHLSKVHNKPHIVDAETVRWFDNYYKNKKIKESITEGGSGSGNFGHAGRPGEVGRWRGSGDSNIKMSEPNYTVSGLQNALKATEADLKKSHLHPSMIRKRKKERDQILKMLVKKIREPGRNK